MGFPMIQVFMIAARQISKPVADAVLHYGKGHPTFRNKILIPLGKSIARFTTRLRMKRLGLGEPTVTTQVSETAALEQASDFVQQVVLFAYSLAVFTGYYMYTIVNTSESVKMDDIVDLKEETNEKMTELETRLKELEILVAELRKAKNVPASKDSAEGTNATSFKRITSLPVDDAAKVVLKDYGEYLVVRSGDSVGIEELERFRNSGQTLRFRKKELAVEPPRKGLIGAAERIVLRLLGRWTD